MKSFLAIAVLGLVLVGVGLGYVWSVRFEQVEREIIDRESSKTVAEVRRAAQQYLEQTDFQTVDVTTAGKRYSTLWQKLQSPEVVRIKVWSPSGQVLWADVNEIIGQRFPVSHELQEALEGQVEVEVEETTESENLAESQYGRLAEIYVPITDDSGSQVFGVIETYRSLSEVEGEVRGMVWRQMLYPGMIALSGYLILLVLARHMLVRRTSNTIP